jgi:hypothetical protein
MSTARGAGKHAGQQKQRKHLCQRCRDRKALFRYDRRVRADRHHTLCFECYRSERERQRAHRLAEPRDTPRQAVLFPDLADVPPGGAPRLTPSQVSHRRLMLRNLERRSPGPGRDLVRWGGRG